MIMSFTSVITSTKGHSWGSVHTTRLEPSSACGTTGLAMARYALNHRL